MDLLAGYGSSDDEKNDSVKEEAKKEVSKTASVPKQSDSSTATRRRGKKILSLQAVLPQHILDQLTKSEVRGDDSDDEDSDDGIAKNRPPAEKKPSAGKDEGLSMLLSDLQKAPKANLATASSTNAKKPPSEKMGAAFLTSTSVTTTKKTGQVRDIHNETAATTASRSVPQPKAPPPNFRRATAAAPPVASTQQPVAPAATAAPQATAQSYEPKGRKRSRKEIEKALRQGNLAAIQDQEGVEHVQQAQPDQYQPQEETYAVPAHGVKVVPTQMYDPSSGQAVAGLAKGRGKNQINQLMQSAASLELARARGAGSQQLGQTHRANAKRKYGW